MKKRRKTPTPVMLLWSRRDQTRFVDAVEKFIATANDLQTLTLELRDLLVVVRGRKRRPAAAAGGDGQGVGINNTPEPENQP